MFFDQCCHKCNHRKHSCFEMILTIMGSILTIGSLIFTIMILCEKKHRKEDRELEEYLEGSIQ